MLAIWNAQREGARKATQIKGKDANAKIDYSRILDVLYEGDTFEDPSRVDLLEQFCQTAVNENTTRKSPPPPHLPGPPRLLQPEASAKSDADGGFLFDLLDSSNKRNDFNRQVTKQRAKAFEVTIPLKTAAPFKALKQVPPPPSPQNEKRFESFFTSQSGILHDRVELPLSPYTKKLGAISPPKSRPKTPKMVHSVDRFVGRKKKKKKDMKNTMEGDMVPAVVPFNAWLDDTKLKKQIVNEETSKSNVMFFMSPIRASDKILKPVGPKLSPLLKDRLLQELVASTQIIREDYVRAKYAEGRAAKTLARKMQRNHLIFLQNS